MRTFHLVVVFLIAGVLCGPLPGTEMPRDGKVHRGTDPAGTGTHYLERSDPDWGQRLGRSYTPHNLPPREPKEIEDPIGDTRDMWTSDVRFFKGKGLDAVQKTQLRRGDIADPLPKNDQSPWDLGHKSDEAENIKLWSRNDRRGTKCFRRCTTACRDPVIDATGDQSNGPRSDPSVGGGVTGCMRECLNACSAGLGRRNYRANPVRASFQN